MQCMYKIILPTIIFVVSSLNAMHDDAGEWLKAAQKVYEKTEGVQHVKEEKDAGHEARESFEKLEQTESPEATQEYDEPNFDENDYSTWFSECPAQGKELSCDYFKGKRYWQRAVSLPKRKKNDLLHHLIKRYKFPDDDNEYAINRCQTAGWVCAGGNPNTSVALFHLVDAGNVLLRPIDHDDYEVIQIVLEHGANPNKTIIFVPSSYFAKNKRMAKLLIKYGAKISKDTIWGTTILHEAINSDRQPSLINFYIKQGIPINSLDRNNRTALHVSALSANYSSNLISDVDLKKTVQYLLKAGIDIDAKDKEGKTAQDSLQECKKWVERCNLVYDLIEEERNDRIKQLQKNGGDHGMHV